MKLRVFATGVPHTPLSWVAGLKIGDRVRLTARAEGYGICIPRAGDLLVVSHLGPIPLPGVCRCYSMRSGKHYVVRAGDIEPPYPTGP